MAIADSVKQGEGVRIPHPTMVNLYGCTLGNQVFIGPFVEIQSGVVIGDNSRISSHSFICEGVTIGKNVFVAHGVMFVNDKFSDSATIHEWNMHTTHVGDGTRIGSNATILPVTIGKNCIIGAGAVVTKDVADNTTVAGVPARVHPLVNK